MRFGRALKTTLVARGTDDPPRIKHRKRLIRGSRVRTCAGPGLFNLGNSLFYLRAHQALPHAPSLVFAGVNLGVVALGAGVGMLAFRERLGRINLVALGLVALLAIAVLALAQ